MKKIFVPAYLKKDVLDTLRKNIKVLEGYTNIGILTTSQHINKLERIKETLEAMDKKAILGGQVLGCNQSNALRIDNEVDCFLYIGSGKFHPLWVLINTEKPVFIANPYTETIEELDPIERQRYLRKRKARIVRSFEAETFGILISTKPGQMHQDKALELKDELEGFGKQVFLFAGSEINPPNILPFKVDAWINTACPRIVDDDFEKPVLNCIETEMLFELLRET